MSSRYLIMPTSTSPYSTTSRRRRFNANDAKYRCCAGRCHVRTGALFVGAAEIILTGLFMIAVSVWFVYEGHKEAHERRYGLYRARYHHSQELLQDPESMARFVFTQKSIIILSVSLSAGFLFLFTVALLFVGIVKETRCLFIAHMICQILITIGFAGLAVYTIVLAILSAQSLFSMDDEKWPIDHDRRWSASVNGLIMHCLQTTSFVIILIVFAAFYLVVYRCYVYLRDSRLYEMKLRLPSTPSPSSTMARQQTIKLLRA